MQPLFSCDKYIIILNYRLLDTPPSLMKSAIVKAPPALEGKGFSQYEAVFLQLADEHRTVNAFELQELLEACLPNGTHLWVFFFIIKIMFAEWNQRHYGISLMYFFHAHDADYIKSCACMEVCRQVVLTMDVSLTNVRIIIFYRPSVQCFLSHTYQSRFYDFLNHL